MPAGREASIEIGSLKGLASEPHRKITTAALFGEAAARDYERFLGKVRDREGALLVAQLLGLLGAGDVTRPMAPGEDPHDAARFVLTLPGKVTQGTTFTFLGTREGRAVSAACAVTDVARVWGFYDGPHFSMRCHVVSSADRVTYELNVIGVGSWAKFSFRGELHSLEDPADRAAFLAQDVVILGAGGIQGFEIRTKAAQVAAVSFYEIVDGQSGSQAWQLPDLAPGWSDVTLATLAIAYLYPWPTSCDARHLAGQTEK